MLDFGQEKGRRAVQEAAKLRFKVQSQKSCSSIACGERSALPLSERSGERIFTNLVQNYTMYIYNVTRIYRISQIYFSYDDSFIVGR